MSEIKGPIYLVTSDIYLRFPEIMDEEFEDLLEYIEDEHIVYEGATDIFYNLKQENQQLKEDLEETRKVLEDTINERDMYYEIKPEWRESSEFEYID